MYNAVNVTISMTIDVLTSFHFPEKISTAKEQVWVLHPTKIGSAFALGRIGYNFKTTKRTLQSSPWRAINWEPGLQLVEIVKLYQSGVKVMHPTKQPNRGVKVLEDVIEAQSANDAMVVWGSDYIVEVSKTVQKSKLQ